MVCASFGLLFFSSFGLFACGAYAAISVIGADNLTAVQPPLPVPEPSTLMLFLGGLAFWQVNQLKRKAQ